MKVLLLTPSPTHLHMGGFATVSRYREGLQQRGHLCEVFGGTSEGGLKQSLEGTLGRFKPDIVHAHDAWRSGVSLLGCRTPWVVSLSGEDLHNDMVEDSRGALVIEVVKRAHRVLVPNEAAAGLVEERVPDAVGKIDVVPRAAVRLATGGTDLRRSLGIPRQRFLVFLPGGVRPIKGQHRAVSLVRVLRAAGADVEMIIAGPDQDEEYAAELRRLCAQQPGVRVLPTLDQGRMGAAYMDADVVLNTSFSEGAAPTILEAGILGRPVIAADVPGNRELIRHKETGLLFDDEEAMAKQVLALYRNRSAAGALGVRIREDFQRRFDERRELSTLLSAYSAA
ncbi:MAG: glycosyltransferase family 4 protein [Planctomycetes bacterium]|nr:glycosyltransferase family 4 protein [Planctomycetota bacterium]MCB9886780.1 glycosyltransferase family 4 protein [Planctomycetota bacterium]